MNCPACRRPAQAGRATCLYCGAPLGAAPPAPAGGVAHAPPPALTRTLLVLDLREAEPAPLARALGLSTFEAGQWVRRGGYRLHRIADPREAEAEARRLAAQGVALSSLAEAEVMAAAQPLVALEGRLGPEGLDLKTAAGRLRVDADELLLVVKGPIARERQAGGELRRLRSARPMPGLRIHLHRRAEPPPLELDPEVLAFGAGAPASALLQLNAWVEALARGRPVDDAFRHLAPALGAAQAAPAGVPEAARALAPRAARGRKEPLLLDNVAQFRFYSAWRGALERRR